MNTSGGYHDACGEAQTRTILAQSLDLEIKSQHRPSR